MEYDLQRSAPGYPNAERRVVKYLKEALKERSLMPLTGRTPHKYAAGGTHLILRQCEEIRYAEATDYR